MQLPQSKPLFLEGKNKTYKYMFVPTLMLWHSLVTIKAYEALTIVDVYIGEKVKDETVDAMSKRIHDSCIFSVVVENNTAFFANAQAIKKGSFFKGMYSLDSKHTVIQLRGFGGRSYKAFLESRYSEMFDHAVLATCKPRFIPRYENEFRVLMGDDELREEIATKLGTDVDNIKELDTRIKLEDELLVIPESDNV